MSNSDIFNARRNFIKTSSLGLVIGGLGFSGSSNAIVAPQPSECILDATYKFENILGLDLVKNYNYSDPFNSTVDSNIITTLNNYAESLLNDKVKLDSFIKRIKTACSSMKEAGLLEGNEGFLGLPKGFANNITAEYISTQSFFVKKPIHPDVFSVFEDLMTRKAPSSATFSQYSKLIENELSINERFDDLFNNANKHLEVVFKKIQSPEFIKSTTRGFWGSLLSIVSLAVVSFVAMAFLPAFAAALVGWAAIGVVAWINS